MSIIFFSVGEAAQVGEAPRRNKLISTDTLAVITTAGYLNNSNTSGKQIAPTDVFDVIYNYAPASGFASASAFGTGTFAQMIPVFTQGVITLQLVVNLGNVLLPVVNGHVAVFNGTSGQIEDSGAALSNASDPYFSMSTGSVTIGQVPKFLDGNGSLGNSGVIASSLPTFITQNLTAVQIQSSYATPQLVISPPGAGKYVLLNAVSYDYTYGSAQFENGGLQTLQYGNTAHAGGIIMTTGVAAASIDDVSANSVLSDTPIPFAGVASAIENTGVYISNASGAFTLGTGTIVVANLWYTVVTF